MKDILSKVAANEKNSKWKEIIKREDELYSRGNDIRSEFERDYTRIIHSFCMLRRSVATVTPQTRNSKSCTNIAIGV